MFSCHLLIKALLMTIGILPSHISFSGAIIKIKGPSI
jgi:hypothetical protein